MKYIKDTIKRYIRTYQCNKVKNTIKAGNVFCSPVIFKYIVNKCFQNVNLNRLYRINKSKTKDEIYKIIKPDFVVYGVHPTKEVGFDEANICQSKRNFNLINTEIKNSCDKEYDELLVNEHLIHIQLYIAKLYATIIKKIIDDNVNPLPAQLNLYQIKRDIIKEYEARIKM
jgi:hypothetical protein